MKFRSILFWLHLATGVIAGIVIAIMSFTGAALAFEKEIIAWAERDARQIAPPDSSMARLPLEELQKRFRAAYPDSRPTSIVVSADPRAAVAFSVGRENTYYANPYTGEFRQPASTKARDFMRAMENWHRWIAMNGDQRATGRAITGACNAAFLVLGLTGLYLWWPRGSGWRALKPSFWFVGAKGKARDWNWHNVIGFWSLPALIVVTASGVVMSYRWANNLVYSLAGDTPPVQGAGPGGPASPQPEITPPAPGARPLGYDALLANVQRAAPGWQTITLQLGGPRGGAGPNAAPAARESREGNRAENAGPRAPAISSPAPGAGGSAEGGERRRAPQAATFQVRGSSGPLFATTTVTLNPFTGDVLTQQSFSELPKGRRARTWLRFLHTGEALGTVGQVIGGLACIGGLFLVYTGFALAIRRFFMRPKTVAARSS